MKRRSVGSGVSWETEFGYSRATRIGNRILVSGTTATGPDGPVAIGDPGEQTRYAIEKIRTAIESLGGTLEDVVRTRIHVKPGSDWEPVAQVHGEFFSAVRPACTLTYADLVGEEYLVEIEVEAVVGSAVEVGNPRRDALHPPGKRRRVYAVDVGSTLSGGFGWTRIDPDVEDATPAGNGSIANLCMRLVEDLNERRNVALGLEAPLFIPVPKGADDLSKGRANEGNRAWSARAGAPVTTLGLHQAAWILKAVAQQSKYTVRFSLDPSVWPPREGAAVLFCWEALVTGQAHAEKGDREGHLRDAATATLEFIKWEDRLGDLPDPVLAERPLSLIGAAALWSGLAEDGDLIRKPTVVLRPEKRFGGRIKNLPEE